MSNTRYMKKKVTAGDIEIDFEKSALCVNYEIQATVLGENGHSLTTQSKSGIKRIRVGRLTENTNISQLAQDIVKKCDMIHRSKLTNVEELLESLQHAHLSGDPQQEQQKQHQQQKQQHMQSSTNRKSSIQMLGHGKLPEASMEDIGEYIDMLYESPKERLQGVKQILYLIQNPNNLRDITENETVMGILSRLLKDEGRKHLELASTISEIFRQISFYTQFHPFLAHNKCGDSCLRTVDFELHRHAKWKADIEKIDLEEQQKPEYKLNLKRYNMYREKVQVLLAVCFDILLNLSENVKVEIKLKKRNILSQLLATLEFDLPQLIIVVLNFLKRLSIFKENKNIMAEEGVVPKLERFLGADGDKHHQQKEVIELIIRLFLNLSFDRSLLNQMIQLGYIPKFVGLLDRFGEDGQERNANIHVYVLRLFYQISIDERSRSEFYYTELIPKVMKMVIECPNPRVSDDVMALAINLSLNARNCEKICKHNALDLLMTRIRKTLDPLVTKFIRNISQHDDCKELFIPHAELLFKLARKCKSKSDLLVELLGTLGNLVVSKIDWARLVTEYDFVAFLQSLLKDDDVDDDILLEAVILVGTLAVDTKCVSLVLQSQLISLVVNIVNSKSNDEEIVLQAIYTVYCLLLHQDSRNYLLKKTNISEILLDHSFSINKPTRSLTNEALEIVLESNPELEAKLKQRRFEVFNANWLEKMRNGNITEDAYEDDSTGNLLFGDESDEDLL